MGKRQREAVKEQIKNIPDNEEVPMLKRMFDKRLKGYKNMGYNVKE